MQLAELKAKAMALQPGERESLAQDLLDSLEREPLSDISEDWLTEIDRRIKDIEEGHVTMIPYEQFRADLREKTGW